MLFRLNPPLRRKWIKQKNNFFSHIDNVSSERGRWNEWVNIVSSFNFLRLKTIKANDEKEERSQILEISSSWIQIRQRECVIFRMPERVGDLRRFFIRQAPNLLVQIMQIDIKTEIEFLLLRNRSVIADIISSSAYERGEDLLCSHTLLIVTEKLFVCFFFFSHRSKDQHRDSSPRGDHENSRQVWFLRDNLADRSLRQWNGSLQGLYESGIRIENYPHRRSKRERIFSLIISGF